LKVVETKIEGRKAEPIPGSEQEIRAPLVVSSIGSVPEKLPGIDMKGEYYTFTDEDLPRYTGMNRVFGVGNVVTGQGNIRVSLVHSQKVTAHLIENYIRTGDKNGDILAVDAAAEDRIADQSEAIEKKIEALPSLSAEQVQAVEQRIHSLQEKAGYTADYDRWIAKVTPPDLE
jgi:ferredoxin/flavodoxin---NADP+ reductase